MKFKWSCGCVSSIFSGSKDDEDLSFSGGHEGKSLEVVSTYKDNSNKTWQPKVKYETKHIKKTIRTTQRKKYFHNKIKYITTDSSAATGVPYRTVPQILKYHCDELTGFEQSEILEYDRIYCIGDKHGKVNAIPHSKCNNGFDHKNGDYRLRVGDHVGFRFEILSRLGRGSFGQVVKVRDHMTEQVVALKVIRNKHRFYKQALVEIEILNLCKNKGGTNHCQIVEMHDSFHFRNHLCISFELLGINLYELICENQFKGIDLDYIRIYAKQLVETLIFNAKYDIIHCDLKPENILICRDDLKAIKVIDYGSACFGNKKMFAYIQSRFYRAPEIIVGHAYDQGIDIWSLGCLLYEMHTGQPLFPGENEHQQLAYIIQGIGHPPKSFLKASDRAHIFFDRHFRHKSRVSVAGKSMKAISRDLHTNPNKFLEDFVLGLLKWKPSERLALKDCLQHPFFAN